MLGRCLSRFFLVDLILVVNKINNYVKFSFKWFCKLFFKRFCLSLFFFLPKKKVFYKLYLRNESRKEINFVNEEEGN